ncbi:MAG: hypothetical protein OEZ13_12380 [Spirochaetia bacterium]|nr:hypothetical protein [Spirochaetia bacterium]
MMKKIALIILALLSTIIDCKNNNITEPDEKEISGLTDAEAVADDAASLSFADFTYSSADTQDSVTGNITLPINGENGTIITWESNHSAIVINNDTGEITRPAYGLGDATVILTATIEKNGVTEKKVFTVTVLQTPPTDQEAVAADLASVEVKYSTADTSTSVTDNLILDTTGPSGTTIEWTAVYTGTIDDASNVISSNGMVSRPSYTDGDANITLTATVSKGLESQTKSFDVIMLKEPPTDAESVSLDASDLDITDIGFTGTDTYDAITGNISLPTAGALGSSITWTSVYTGTTDEALSVISSDGIVTQPSFDGVGHVAITLKATISKGSYSTTKTFDVKVLQTIGFETTAFTWSVPVAPEVSKEADYNTVCNGEDWGINILNQGYCGGWSTIDINNDGKLDLVSTRDNSDVSAVEKGRVYGFGTGAHYWKVFLGTAAGFSATAVEWIVPVAPEVSAEANYDAACNGEDWGIYLLNRSYCSVAWNTIDINNDGKLDLVSTRDNSDVSAVEKGRVYGFGSGAHFWKVFPGTDTGFSATAVEWTVPIVPEVSAEADYDATCNGEDWGIYLLNRSYCSVAWNTIDINNDGKLDLVSTRDNSDVSGVEKGRVYGFGTGTHYWKVFPGTDTGFSATAVKWPVPIAPEVSAEADYDATCNGEDWGIYLLNRAYCDVAWNTIDINNDGKLDLVSTRDNSDVSAVEKGRVYGFGTGAHYWKVFLGK